MRATGALITTMIAVLGTVAACDKAGDHGAEAAPAPGAPKPAPPKDRAMNDLTWKMQRTDNKLHVTYHYENHTGDIVYVVDGLVIPAFKKPNVYTRTTGGYDIMPIGTDTVMIKVGPPSGGGTAPTPAFFVPVAAGASYDGARDIALPFTTSDPITGADTPLPGKRTTAKFSLYATKGEPKWRELPGDGGPIRFPDAPGIWVLTGDAQPIP